MFRPRNYSSMTHSGGLARGLGGELLAGGLACGGPSTVSGGGGGAGGVANVPPVDLRAVCWGR